MGPFTDAHVSITGILIFGALAFVAWLWRTGREHAKRDQEPQTFTVAHLGSKVTREKCATCGTEHSPILPCATILRDGDTK